MSVNGALGNAHSPEETNGKLLMSHLLSPQRTGLYDEVMALYEMGVLRRTCGGRFVLSDKWYNHVDPLLLEDWALHWGKDIDPKNKHCLSELIRDELATSWSHVEGGWALSNDAADIVFLDDEWEEWQRHFRDRHESHLNEAEGIEKFGV